jgi:O-antigen ligase
LNGNFTYKNIESRLELLAYVGMGLLFFGFLFNRVVSNAGFVVIGIYTLTKFHDVKWLFKDKWLLTFLSLALLPLLSDILLEGLDFYKFRGVMKFLLVLFPFFIFALKPQENVVRNFIYLFLGLMLLSSFYSLFHYFSDISNMASVYKVSKVIPVLSFGDHIRISWATVISCLLALYLLTETNSRFSKVSLGVYIIFQMIFLHLLGSKTGLISLYLTLMILALYTLKGKAKWLIILIAPLILLLPLIAYKTIPSFEQRFNFIKYDFEHYSRGEYKDGLSDAVRFYSLRAGKDIVTSNPLFGTGFSSLQDKTNEWYKSNIPAMPAENYFLPSNQLLIYWASGGILGLVVFLMHIILPFFTSYLRNNVWFMAFFIPSIFSFMYETHFEGQLPLFVYSFFVSWFWFLAYKKNAVNTDQSE